MLSGTKMPMTGAPADGFDYPQLATYLAALAYPLRLELLAVLKLPHTLSEIRVVPHRLEQGENPDRPAAKQTVLAHLEKLVEAGLVQVRETEHGARTLRTYAVSPQRLFAITEELRRVLVQYAGHGVPQEHTGTIQAGGVPPAPSGPRLVLVQGVYEGRVFLLDRPSQRDGSWTIGRRSGIPIALDYDPYVSTEHSRVISEGDGFAVQDLGSKNGTTLNWQRITNGARQPLRSGDLIGAGRSRLLFLQT